MKDQPKLKDIARLANVSIGTVDRAIHNRGRISPATREKIMKAIEELNYKPNEVARMLSIRTKNIIAVLIPSHSPEDYWDLVENGICKAEKEMEDYGFTIRRFYFDRYDIHSFVDRINEIKSLDDITGYVISPQYMQESKDFAAYLDSIKKPFIFIDSNIDNCNQLSYFGIDSYNAGIVLSTLVADQLHENEEILFALFQSEGSKRSTQIELIEEGFENQLKKLNYHRDLHKLFISVTDAEREDMVKRYFADNPQIRAAVVFNSLSYEIAGILERNNIQNVKVFGFDLINKNLHYLKSGYIKFLISQRPESQGYQSMKTLYRHLTFPIEQIENVHFMPIDILMKENVNFYHEV